MLAVLLLAGQLCRAMAVEENQTGFRQEYYIEEKDRIKVTTQSVLFDAELHPNVRLNGSLVLDAISGASPIGAPARTQWQFPTYGDYYNSFFNQTYANQFNQYVAANQVFVDAGFITFQQMTNDAAIYANTTTPPIATGSADASFQALTNNPNYSSRKVPVAQLEDQRTAFSLAPTFTLGRHLITPSFAYSEESDYISYVGALNYSLLLNEKNTTLNFGWAHNADSVRDDLFVFQDKRVNSLLIGCVQLLSPKSFATVSLTYVNEKGYLTDPYRGVMFTTTSFNELQTNPDDPATDPEHRPGRRERRIAYFGYTHFIDALNGGAECSYRFSHDSWDVLAHTIDLRWQQKIGSRLIVTPSFRYYVQSATDFYYPGLVPGGSDRPQNYSSDYRLSHMQTLTYGLRVSWWLHKNVSLDAGYQRYVMEGRDDTSPSAYPVANVFSIGGRIWF